MDVKVDRKATKPQTDPTGKKKISKKMKIIYGAIIMLVVVSLLVFTIWWCHNKLFTENPRFVLRRIELNTMSNGYWKNRESSMWRRLGLKEGENIFSVDLKKTREKLLCISNLSNAEVEIVLPDTLKIDLTERVPRAFLGNESSPWVLDDKCILVPRSETIATRLDLPVIIGYRDKKKKHYYSGTELEDARAAMALIMTVNQYFPKIKVLFVERIGTGNPVNDKLKVWIKYFDREVCCLYLPAIEDRNIYNNKLLIFQNAIEKARAAGDNRNTFNLLFRDKVIIP